MSRKIYALSAALTVAAVALLGTASISQAVPGKFWGVVPQATPTLEQLQRLRRGGVDSVRVPIVWPAVQATQAGPFDWSAIDKQIENAARAGIEVLPFLSSAPEWAVPSVFVPGSRRTVKAPRNLPASGAAASGWSAFASAAVARYGPNGAFWAEHLDVPARPIRTWQIWNEQNFKYFVVRPNPAEYGRLLNLSFRAIRSVDPSAKLVLGGMFARPKEALFKRGLRQAYFATDFLDRVYETTPGVKGKFAGVALHPYTSRYRELFPDIEAFRAVLEEHRDGGKGLWITEIGWSSQPLDPLHNSFAKGPQGQAAQLKGAFSLFKRWQARWRLKRIYWFSVDDHGGICNFCDGSGLFGPGFAPKKSWFAYVKFAGGSPG